MKIRDIIKSEGRTVFTIGEGDTVHQAVRSLVDHNIGALPVVDTAGKPAGIISERDILRLCSRDDFASALGSPVSEVMTRELVIAFPQDPVEYVMNVMTERHIRHVPIMEGGDLVGLVSIGDLVKAKGDESQAEARFLRDYLNT